MPLLISFCRFYFSRTAKNGVAIRKAIKAAMPKPKVRAKVKVNQEPKQ